MTSATPRPLSSGSCVAAGEEVRPVPASNGADPAPADWMRRRWTPLKKFEILEAVRSGELAIGDLWDRLRISEPEFASWRQTFDEFGYSGLKTTHLQSLRRLRGRAGRFS